MPSSTEAGFLSLQPSNTSPSKNEYDYSSVVSSLRSTFKTGKTKDVEWRKQQLLQLKKLIVENHKEIAQAVLADVGGPKVRAAPETHTYTAVDQMLAGIDKWTQVEERTHTEANGRSYVRREPKGVALLIAPWNYPFLLTIEPLVCIIAAGNCCVIKPSEVSVNTAKVITKLFPKYLDTDAFTVVNGAVPETTALLKEKFDHIMFTGNGGVGKIVLRAAAEHLTPCTLELGGKSPVYVDKSANLEAAANRISLGKWFNAGQICVAPDYVIVHDDVYESFKVLLLEKMKTMYGVSDAKEENGFKIVNNSHVGRIQELLKSTEAKRLLGGKTGDQFVATTVLEDPKLSEKIMQEEIFGPLLPLLRVKDKESALEIIDGVCDSPLSLYVFAEDQTVSDYVISNTKSGMVSINTTFEQVTNLELPLGGIGESGMGQYHGEDGFREFSYNRAFFVKDTKESQAALLPPKQYMDDGLYDIVSGLS